MIPEMQLKMLKEIEKRLINYKIIGNKYSIFYYICFLLLGNGKVRMPIGGKSKI